MSTQCRMMLDVDTGIDDAMAIVFALNRESITLEAISTVYGNIDVETTTRNTLQILEAAGRTDIQVGAGAARALTMPYHGGVRHIHGSNGIGDVELPAPTHQASDVWGPDLIIKTIRDNPGEISLVPVGPMTNVALALMKAPDIAGSVKQIVLMGSTLSHPGVPGIPSPMADANFYNDPEAARIIFQSGAKVVAVGMDVTMKTKLTSAMIDHIAQHGGPASKITMQAARFYLGAYQAQYPGIDHCALHDPLAVAVAEDPSIVKLEPMRVDIECRGEITRGQMIPDRRRTGKIEPNALVAVDVDSDRFEKLFIETLNRK
ncbi:MAG: nucleoside hydrolase [Alphaproteobacteria bacterium]|nr:nucleoside hydrolase [Alphaproteobacteria bacterium]